MIHAQHDKTSIPSSGYPKEPATLFQPPNAMESRKYKTPFHKNSPRKNEKRGERRCELARQKATAAPPRSFYEQEKEGQAMEQKKVKKAESQREQNSHPHVQTNPTIHPRSKSTPDPNPAGIPNPTQPNPAYPSIIIYLKETPLLPSIL